MSGDCSPRSRQGGRAPEVPGTDNSRISPKTKPEDEIDESSEWQDRASQNELDNGNSSEENNNSDVDERAGGDAPISCRTRSCILSGQIPSHADTGRLTRRPLHSTQGHEVKKSKPAPRPISPALPLSCTARPHSGFPPKKVSEEGSYRKSVEAGTKTPENKTGILIPVSVIALFVCSTLFFLVFNRAQPVRPSGNTVLKEFLERFDVVEARFKDQLPVLWKRSRITLRNHINLTAHSKPAILMFAAAQDGQRTMQCLAYSLAEAYSSTLNATTLEIDGSGKTGQNSDAVKLDMDEQLASGFDRDTKAAVIHHFQDLPPLSTLIFYKYCDHENAAYKSVSLIITVALDEEKLRPDESFSSVEVKVRDFLKKKFCISRDPAGNVGGMDIDKLSGLWSRIAHVVLPVKPIQEIEMKGCETERKVK